MLCDELPLRKRWAPSRHSGDSSLSPNEPRSSLTMMSANSGADQCRMSHDTTVTSSPQNSAFMFSNLHVHTIIIYHRRTPPSCSSHTQQSLFITAKLCLHIHHIQNNHYLSPQNSAFMFITYTTITIYHPQNSAFMFSHLQVGQQYILRGMHCTLTHTDRQPKST